ncbi:PROTEIN DETOXIFICATION [Salix viminalis]|uniref:PROTEIN DETOXIFICATION n=1 Tax=Salix viminalis TaxID=40686 RepID=A0A9Q0ZDH2_SALVM|nr:PROTEIN DETOXIFICATION [Salix viminalis]
MGRINNNGDDLHDTLLPYDQVNLDVDEENQDPLASRIWTETKKLWEIVGPAIFSRVATFSMNIITQAFAGHLGDVELAAISIANTVIVGFNFGLLLGMASALETMCGTSFWCKKIPHAGNLHAKILDCSILLLFPALAILLPIAEVLAEPAKESSDSLDLFVIGMFIYTSCGGCPSTWTGFSAQAFSGLWEFVKLSAASGVMLCLENWYYRILILMTGYLDNATLAVDALSVCMSINGWEIMIPLAFFAATGVRVSNELGAGNGKGAKFATIVSVVQSSIVGLIFCLLIMLLHNKIALIVTSSSSVIHEVDSLAFLLAITILLNSVQPVLSGVAVGSRMASSGWVFKLGVKGIWSGMIFGGTAVQTVILVIMTVRSDWDKEAEKARINVNKWSQSKPVVQ